VAGGLPSLWPSSGIESQHVGLDNEVNPSALSIVRPRGPRCQVWTSGHRAVARNCSAAGNANEHIWSPAPGAAAFWVGVRWRMLAPRRRDVVVVSGRSLLEVPLELLTAGSTVPGRAVGS
jgi:hypothetical protein